MCDFPLDLLWQGAAGPTGRSAPPCAGSGGVRAAAACRPLPAAVSAAADLSVPPHDFFTASARALTAGPTKAGVRRLVVVGLSSIMPGASGAL
ncbi:hypothetical protein [Planomonospora parontospora]|uniref:hypothetical protein n=1 Tax=Planomonospora parontospora TaxID=58119 RepID=UPI00199F944C|nr:hypothetical protein [Planomonospora parontospora]GGL33459.1 hypothetical protein GCM10014719_38340 [Planomonospora parontospora subsp. antibiotica]GII16944.1 hypothetical protein Ppa05_36700 [Planomonospora parontospora subsp. antibiotica]